MKTFFLLPVVLLLYLGTSAQKVSFTDMSNKWYVMNVYNVAAQGHTIHYKTERFFYTDSVQYKGHTYYEMSLYDGLSKFVRKGVALVRFDTAMNQVLGLDVGTEYVLFDYNIKLGDTVTAHYISYDLPLGDSFYSRTVLTKIDSVLINNIYHKKYHMTGIPDTANPNLMGKGYVFVEGVGGMSYPIISAGGNKDIYQFDKIQEYFMCFRNNTVIGYPIANSCDDTTLSVEELVVSDMAEVYPQPTYDVAHIKLPKAIKAGTLVLYNGMGQIVKEEQFTGRVELTVNRPTSGTGVYFYRILSDGDMPNRYSGRLLFR
ncbi:MAG: T9SS type A sorting domain-containing protein [Chitinophagales bacterium]|nr:T9SS type A sorting domain-containing protein [Chitinophagaceae bacterium]MCB9065719.1 T9SS type A sorting domain-containing protein [Chitinophagales bacterium]